MKRLTKEAMVKDIFFLVTAGKRCAENFVDGMWLIETVARANSELGTARVIRQKNNIW